MVGSSKDSLKTVIETDQIVENIKDSRFVGSRHGLVFAEARIKADELESRILHIIIFRLQDFLIGSMGLQLLQPGRCAELLYIN